MLIILPQNTRHLVATWIKINTSIYHTQETHLGTKHTHTQTESEWLEENISYKAKGKEDSCSYSPIRQYRFKNKDYNKRPKGVNLATRCNIYKYIHSM